MTDTPRDAPAVPLPGRRPRIGLSGKLLVLTALCVMVSEVFIYVPSMANFRLSWLEDRMATAEAAALVLTGTDQAALPRGIQEELLTAVGADGIAIRSGEVSWLISLSDMLPEIDQVADLREAHPVSSIMSAFETLFSPREQVLRVVSTTGSGDEIELVMGDRRLRAAMLRYSFSILALSAIISILTAAAVYLALNFLFVRPMLRMSQSMSAFSAAPEDTSRIVRPSGRTDEIGDAEEHLADMQRALSSTLQQQRHLADLGLAVSKINHDLRNMLASAQIISDRLGTVPDPTVQRFAPKLIEALDRAIAYCQASLAYGRPHEEVPERRLIALDHLVDDVGGALGLDGPGAAVKFENYVPKGLEVDADPGQLSRILVNLGRNSIQAMEAGPPALVRRLMIEAKREGGVVTIRVCDTGPGIPEKARARLFHAFQGSAKPGGTGLGLAIAAELARAHGGEIRLAETAAPGAHFEIVIPDQPIAFDRAGGARRRERAG